MRNAAKEPLAIRILATTSQSCSIRPSSQQYRLSVSFICPTHKQRLSVHCLLSLAGVECFLYSSMDALLSTFGESGPYSKLESKL